YDHFIPSVVDALSSRGEFATAYTPYQPEAAQGTLQAIFEYQTSMVRLTGMEVSNASLYDGGTALIEALLMSLRVTGRHEIILDGGVSPIFRKMIQSTTKNLEIKLVEVPVTHGRSSRDAIKNVLSDQTAAVILQNPNFFGVIDDHTDMSHMAHEKGALSIQSVYPISLALIKSPGEQDIDIATGEGQSLGIPLSFGGPYLGFLTSKMKFVRKMPGRIVGLTEDSEGRPGYVLTLQAREQHIRREKATSNICSNHSLLALRAVIYLSVIGKSGLRDVAKLCLDKAEYLKSRLDNIPGVKVKRSSPTFNEFTVELPRDAGEVIGAMIEKGFAAGFPLGRYYPGLENYLLVAVTEKRTKEEIGQLVEALETVLK
ncbi:aminomethyl-transferring glycine dehydrogenase subunit GcvPA, partial [PVC group bacterium]|nr:aminomethyl-transferring glycine dehydrogenase subunit GcvPA [PVC group bacterium]